MTGKKRQTLLKCECIIELGVVMANGTTNAGLMDRNVPAQLDMADLEAELELAMPDSGNDVMAMTVVY
jgi:hypothetical protein